MSYNQQCMIIMVMMYLSQLMVHICSMFKEQLADISVAFLPSHRERSKGVLSKLMIAHVSQIF